MPEKYFKLSAENLRSCREAEHKAAWDASNVRILTQSELNARKAAELQDTVAKYSAHIDGSARTEAAKSKYEAATQAALLSVCPSRWQALCQIMSEAVAEELTGERMLERWHAGGRIDSAFGVLVGDTPYPAAHTQTDPPSVRRGFTGAG